MKKGRMWRWLTLAVVAGILALPGGSGGGDKKKPDKDSAGKIQEKEFAKEVTLKVRLSYLLYLPKDYGKEDRTWPVVLFLHGTGDKIERLKSGGVPRLAEKTAAPFILVVPQGSGKSWDVGPVAALLDDVVARYKADRNSIYVTGFSMGGVGAWALAAAYPDKFAAIIPISGAGNPADARKLKHLPIWVFHGARDTVVPPSRAEAMVKALKDAGAENVRFTLYPEAGHDAWTETYGHPQVWNWLLRQKRREQ